MKNAVKFKPFFQIDMEAYYNSERESFNILVKDTGVGIDPEDLPNLFTRFGNLTRKAEMNNEGIGLGLTIIKQIVK